VDKDDGLKNMKKISIGIAFSGGSARGIAHIGVLKALQEADIYPSIVAGTSAGSIVGAMYAAGKTPEEMLQFVQETSLFKVFKPGLPFNGLSKLTYVQEQLEKYIPHNSFEGLERKLYVIVTNMNTGSEERLFSGSLSRAVVASCSIPMLFKPVEINGSLYADGGIMNNFPTDVLLGKVNMVIGVNVMPLYHTESTNLNSVLGIGIRTFELSIWNNTMPNLLSCDVVIEPEEINKYNIMSLQKAEVIYQKGYDATKRALPDILERMKELGGIKVDGL
jgi:NTE family protein